jgi:hypothetical protein
VTLAAALASQAGETVLLNLKQKANSLAANAGDCGIDKLIQCLGELEIDLAHASGNTFLGLTLQQYSGYARRAWCQ